MAATPVLTSRPSDELRAGRSLRLAKSVSSAAPEQPWHRNQGRHRPAPGLQDGLSLDNMAGAASATSKGRRRGGAGRGGAGREEQGAGTVPEGAGRSGGNGRDEWRKRRNGGNKEGGASEGGPLAQAEGGESSGRGGASGGKALTRIIRIGT